MARLTWHDHEVRNAAILRFNGLLFLVLAAATLAPAQTVWDGIYTDAQATRGLTAFSLNCSRCHTLAAEGKSPLVGAPFWKSFAQKTVGDMVGYISANMPNGAPGSLSEATYRDIVAALLKSNDFPAGKTELAGNNMGGLKIVPKDGSRELPADALVRVFGCLTRIGPDWAVTRATTPERAESRGQDDATRPLGTGIMALKFVVTRLDPLAGSRVAVTGLQIGAGGVDGLNVTTVTRVADKCP